MMMACPKLLVLLLVVCTALLQHGDARPSRSRKAAPGRQRVCLRGIKAYRKCYLAIEEPKHYHEANEDCIAQGGTLAIPRDMQENNDLREYAKRSSPGAKDFWIGVTDIVKEGQYVDVNSMPVTFFNWDKSKKQPTGGKRVSCVTLSLAAQGRWHDEVCRSQKKYICEYLIP
ncbi:tetranectin-like protein isoform X4 [Alosa alosa]|uniref:tetranectin-like protein isoform X5 n=1 Tax=Alosa sapidissima TaxID=34773 RepID=UPI001C090999|nr:tetranectin-like protein isoform X5 [Alosa sapidissima]XP_048119297.1 tetranectin-like protein isoform X4 [Alosa alosa]